MSLEDRLGGWYDFLKDEFEKEYMKKISVILKKERAKYNIAPPAGTVFRPYRECSFIDTKVVILAEHPYTTPGIADGLAFSSKEELFIPDSLKYIQEEIQNEFNVIELGLSNDLSSWAEQGVLLLNISMTTRGQDPLSHAYIGWDKLIEKTIEVINISPQPIVFLLWGEIARKYIKLIDYEHHKVLNAPSPEFPTAYKGFLGCNHFVECNNFLENNNLKPINWLSNKIK